MLKRGQGRFAASEIIKIIYIFVYLTPWGSVRVAVRLGGLWILHIKSNSNGVSVYLGVCVCTSVTELAVFRWAVHSAGRTGIAGKRPGLDSKNTESQGLITISLHSRKHISRACSELILNTLPAVVGEREGEGEQLSNTLRSLFLMCSPLSWYTFAHSSIPSICYKVCCTLAPWYSVLRICSNIFTREVSTASIGSCVEVFHTEDCIASFCCHCWS